MQSTDPRSPEGAASGLAAPPHDFELQRRIFDAAMAFTEDFIYAFGLDGRFLFANKALCDLLQLSSAEIIGKTFFDLPYPKSLAETLHEQIDSVIGSKTRLRAETQYTSPTGTTGVYEYIFTPVFNSQGEVEAVTGTTRDITDRFFDTVALDARNRELSQEAHLAKIQVKELQSLFEQAPGFMCVLSGPEHVFELVNNAYRALIGDERPLIGLSVASALPEATRQGYLELLDAVYASGRAYVGRGMAFEVNNGQDTQTRTILDFVYQPLFDAEGAVHGIFCQGHDVSEQYKAIAELKGVEEALRESASNKDRFLATLAHELRNPLAPIGISARLLTSKEASDEVIERSGQIILRQSVQMARLLDDLLDVARISTGRFELKFETSTIEALVATAVETARPRLDAGQHKLIIDVKDGLSVLKVDVVRVAQVIANILDNAAKYMDPYGEVRLEAALHGDDFVLSVSDQGIGIQPGSLVRVFDMFSQENAPERASGGLGIGLALAKGVVDLHGGRIEAQSAGLGQGARFIMTLPATRAEDREVVVDRTGQPAVHAMTVLIADDNVDAAESMALLLRLQNYEVHTAASGPEALELGASIRPDVVILDIGMPKLNGYEVAAKIRAADWGHPIVLIAATGWGQSEDRARSLDAGFDHHLTKPIDLDRLAKILSEAKEASQPASA